MTRLIEQVRSVETCVIAIFKIRSVPRSGCCTQNSESMYPNIMIGISWTCRCFSYGANRQTLFFRLQIRPNKAHAIFPFRSHLNSLVCCRSGTSKWSNYVNCCRASDSSGPPAFPTIDTLYVVLWTFACSVTANLASRSCRRHCRKQLKTNF